MVRVGEDLRVQSGLHASQRDHFVTVAVRVKPAPEDSNVIIWAKSPEKSKSHPTVCFNRGYFLEEYEFSRIFGPEDDNLQLFQDLQGPSVTASVFGGVNETLFAYGQTGSGKTHTIFGTDAQPGLLQHYVQEVFDQSSTLPGSTVHVSCYEVFGDTFTDLIEVQQFIASGQISKDEIVQDEFFLKTQRYRYQIVRVSNASSCLDLLQLARMNRLTGISSCNRSSSRSHAIVHLFVQNPASSASASRGQTRSSIGALTLVDLAGAEREHENPSEQGRKSARLLNTSLSSLNRLLRKLQTNSLNESERRQSVLNTCLWEYLRPGCGIALVFCVSPLAKHREFSFSTLSMALDSKHIHGRRKAQFIQVPPAPVKCQAQGVQDNLIDSHGQHHGMSTPSIPRRGRQSTPSPMRVRSSSAAGRTAGVAQQRRSISTCSPCRKLPVDEFALAQESPRAEPCTPGNRDGGLPHGGREVPEAFCQPGSSQQRARSQERLVRIEKEHDQLRIENTMLRRECESLRELFIRQQEQNIAFWSGPFMDMMVPRDKGAASSMTPMSPAKQFQDPARGSRDNISSLQKERDYWRALAAKLKRDAILQGSEVSTSQNGSEFCRTPCSDSEQSSKSIPV